MHVAFRLSARGKYFDAECISCTIQPSGGKVVAAWFSSQTRGVAMGVRLAGLPLGAALGALILPAVAELDGWRAAFEAGALAALAGGLAFALLYRPPPDAGQEPAHEEFTDWRAASRRCANFAPECCHNATAQPGGSKLIKGQVF